MKNWQIIMDYAHHIDVICDLYLHGTTTKEQETIALRIEREWIEQERADCEVDFTGYSLIIGFINEVERGTHAINYITVLSAICEGFHTTAEYDEFENRMERLEKRKTIILDNGMTEEETEEWTEKFFSAL